MIQDVSCSLEIQNVALNLDLTGGTVRDIIFPLFEQLCVLVELHNLEAEEEVHVYSRLLSCMDAAAMTLDPWETKSYIELKRRLILKRQSQ